MSSRVCDLSSEKILYSSSYCPTPDFLFLLAFSLVQSFRSVSHSFVREQSGETRADGNHSLNQSACPHVALIKSTQDIDTLDVIA